MKTVLIGSPTDYDFSENVPYLVISWEKSLEGYYIHHASIIIKNKVNSLFPPELAKVEAVVREHLFKNKKVIKKIDTPIARYLPVEYNDDGISIPLNSWEIIESLETNLWTSSKKRNRINLKQFPQSLSFAIPGVINDKFNFSSEENCTPYLLSETFFDNISGKNCITLLIHDSNDTF